MAGSTTNALNGNLMTKRRPTLTPLQRLLAQAPRPADGTPGRTCDCKAHYLDYPEGHDAHEAVFGHRPREPGQRHNPDEPPPDDY